MRPLIVLLKTLFMAACAVLIFGPITQYLRRQDQFIPIQLPAWISYVGGAFMIAGAILAFICFGLFARGVALTSGSTFPDPTTFVSRGPYLYMRNPMAVGSLTSLAGWGLFERSTSVLLLTVVMAGLMHLLVVFVEEPKLERRFGQSYLSYKTAFIAGFPGEASPAPDRVENPAPGSFPRNFPQPRNSGII
jgi:protein-S-isoprenylcysteine O-methyltransferase Ste14